MRRIEDTLGTNVTQTWDFDLNPVELQVQFLFFNRLKIARLNFLQYLPYEQVQVLELIRTENKICNKIVTVLAAICCECKFLVYECERKFLPAILFFGEGGTFIDDLVHELIRYLLRSRCQRTTTNIYGTFYLISTGWLIRSMEIRSNISV